MEPEGADKPCGSTAANEQKDTELKEHRLPNDFPKGLRVLVVDDDPLCLKITEQMLKRCNYEVCTCATAATALEQLREKSHNFDLVLSDVYMPDMDGFKLLEAIGLELDLPVIMMSSNGEHTTVMRGVTHGACDFLIKPVRIEELRNIWQHVIRRTRTHTAAQQLREVESEEGGIEGDGDSNRKRKELCRDGSMTGERDDDAGSSKKPRVVWSVEMHQQFVQAVNQLGIDSKPLTPHEALLNVKPDVSHLATFGCQAYYSVPRILRNNKFSPPAARAIMVGYAAQGKGYRLLTDNGSILERSSVTFNEKHFPAKNGSSSSSYRNLLLPNLHAIFDAEPSSVPRTPVPAAAPAPEPAAAAAPEPSGPAYSTRARTNTALTATATALAPEPQNYKEATSRPDAPLWVDAMDTEIHGIRSNGTWVLGFPPPGTKVLDTKWTYKLKRNSDGSTERHKARVVAKGFQQQEGRDYFEIFAPVGKYTSMRALTAKAAAEDLIIHNIDFSSAFLNGTLEEELWIKQPEGYVEGEPGMACKLVKSLYGLKQAPRVWHLNLDEIIQEKGFKPSEADPCLYYYTGSEYHPETYLLVYVDDVAIYTKSQESADALISYFSSKYKLRDLGAAEQFLGISITRQPTGIKLAQERMIDDLVAKHGMENSNGRLLPMSPGTKLTKDEDREPLDTSKYPYATLVGALLYLANCTRPDIAYPVGVLARFMANPRMSHWQAAKGVLRYLAGTSTYGLNYSKAGSSSTLIGYTDSDFAGDADTRRSTAGFTFIKGNAAICWQSKRQPTVATSTTEAEYMGAATSVKEALWLGVLHRDIGYNITTVEIKADNQSALAILHNPVTSGRAKHIDVAYHFARERAQRGDVSFSYISTNEMTADIMTKALPAPKFEYCRRQMGVY